MGLCVPANNVPASTGDKPQYFICHTFTHQTPVNVIGAA